MDVLLEEVSSSTKARKEDTNENAQGFLRTLSVSRFSDRWFDSADATDATSALLPCKTWLTTIELSALIRADVFDG
jgi:hypothetical protein